MSDDYFYDPDQLSHVLTDPVATGFRAPTDDFTKGTLDLNQYLVQHPLATFFLRVKGQFQASDPIYANDVLVVDRSLTPQPERTVVVAMNGDLSVKKLTLRGNNLVLIPTRWSSNRDEPPVQVTSDFSCWGVVTHAIRAL